MQHSLILKYEVIPVLNIAMHLNDICFIRLLEVENTNDADSGSISITVETDIPCMDSFRYEIDFIPAQRIVAVPLQAIKVNRNFLNRISENEKAVLTIKLFEDGKIIQSVSEQIVVHSLDYFSGFQLFPQLLPAYITPNHPYIYHIKRKAVAILEKNRQNPAFEGYQSQDPGRIMQLMSAIYSAIKDEGIAYSALPPGYEKTGQRLRLLNTIQNEKFGNCIDLSLLFAACLEAIDLHAIIIITQGHAFAGCWLQPDTFSEIINDDKTAITKRLAKGIREIAVVEATSVCKGKAMTFTDALNAGEAQLIGREEFILSIDVKRARAERIRPLPIVETEGSGITLNETLLKERQPPKMQTAFEIGRIYEEEAGTYKPKTKQEIWQRKLLDLSLRNNLLNIRMTRNMLQLVDIDVHHMEDRLADGKSFTIHPNPGAEIQKRYNVFVAQQHTSSVLYELATEELKRNRLLTYYHQVDLDNILNYIHKNAKLAIEENGSSTLFLAIGLLKWYDRKMPNQPRYAPILLIPVEISRRSVNSRFTLKSREEEAMINITLLEFLRQEYELNLSHLEELPTDDKGVDVARLMGIFRRAVMQLKGWDVEEQMILGNFSFSKLILWKDIVVHQQEIIKSPAVNSLIEGRLQETMQGNKPVTAEPEHINPVTIALPIPTDVSQMQAVLAAQQGKSFVLHGPPGTGKSQTITNIIADALYHGKKVLFVAAKKAALDVVHKRMEQIGLDIFSLELHANKSRKSDVLQQLERTLETAKRLRNFDFEKEAARLDNAKREISQYVTILHKKQKIGFSLYDSIAQREQYIEHKFERVAIPGILDINERLFQQWEDWLPQFEAIVKCIAHPASHPYQKLSLTNYTPSLQEDLQVQTRKLLQLLPPTMDATMIITEKVRFPFAIQMYEEWEQFLTAITLWKSIPDTHLDLCIYMANRENRTIFTDWLYHFSIYQQLANELLLNYETSILKADIHSLRLQWKQAEQKWFLPKWMSKNKIRKAVAIYSKNKIRDDETIIRLFEKYQQYSEEKEILERSRFAPLIKAMQSLYNDHQTDLTEIKSRTDVLFQIADALTVFPDNVLMQWITEWRSRGYTRTRDMIHAEAPAISAFIQQAEALQSALHIYQKLSGIRIDTALSKHWIAALQEQLQSIQQYFPELRDWVNYVNICQQGRTYQLQWLIDAFGNNIVTAENLQSFFKYTVATALAEHVIAQHESLNLFNSNVFESKISHYKNIAGNFQQITRTEVFLKLSEQLPNANLAAIQSSELGILQRAIKSRGRGMSIRRLFTQIPNLLPRLVPCMLMSPISVAQYFDVNTDHFDLVIFDEASQLPTCEAISALSRAKQAIVVGDPKQMPPTSFFSTNKVDEENIEVEDMESILDDCLALSMPSHYLLRHYRSRHESLIAFSNVNYYENKLLTFPSADDLNRKVKFHPVKGFYDKGKTRQNKFEADVIISFIRSHYSNTNTRNRSIGVVTFSQVQQSLIEDKLQEFYSANPDIEQFITESPEPLFVKNLENVQGDERDIILFSVCYGPDEDGKVSMNFGPLNRDGGWRRLNVAITRARHEMHLFSTLTADHIDLNRTAAEGVAGLKGFLQFAEKGILSLPSTQLQAFQYTTSLSASISKALEERGLKLKTNIGTSGFKIDIGVLHPQKDHQYILGIITDGKYYYDAQTSNDREMVMPIVLRGLGWHIYRIWTMDWYTNKERILNEIVEKIEQLTEEKPNEAILAVEEETRTAIQELAIEELPATEIVNSEHITAQRAYTTSSISSTPDMTSESVYHLKNKNLLQAQIRNIIQAESPISKNYLFRRILQTWNITRTGTRIEQYLLMLIDDLKIESTQHLQIFYWSKDMRPETLDYYRDNAVAKRSIDDVAPEELAVAIKEVIAHNISIEEEELIRYLARLFGYSKVGRQIDNALRYSINYTVQNSSLVKENGRIMQG